MLCEVERHVGRVGLQGGGKTVGERVVLVLQFHVRKKKKMEG